MFLLRRLGAKVFPPSKRLPWRGFHKPFLHPGDGHLYVRVSTIELIRFRQAVSDEAFLRITSVSVPGRPHGPPQPRHFADVYLEKPPMWTAFGGLQQLEVDGGLVQITIPSTSQLGLQAPETENLVFLPYRGAVLYSIVGDVSEFARMPWQ